MTVPPSGHPGDPGHPGDLLSAHLDDELAPEVANAVEAHVAGCPRCAEELAELGATRLALRTAPRLSAPPGFARDLLRSRRRASRRGAALALVAASVAVVAGLALAPAHPDASADPPSLALRSQAARFEASAGGLTTTSATSSLLAAPGAAAATTSPSAPPTTSSTTPTTSPGPGPGDAGGDGDRSVGERVGDAVGALLDAIGG
jgi:anti-sigma factor RsiW